ncbi:type VI secretion system-associated protein TagF [Paraburkholderia sacchari]|uniref:type VI secretion system-associated protein TagF n=1 Tax=Paraburkholderia sacchari TaxID=159450 RepID=UPI0005427010|nr:type VI secretion system-associated protein TagF [Paraburkholderia sacchari]NLP60395.1 type VI secretion system-associated protein TagF [Paraburkholderia sacchari]
MSETGFFGKVRTHGDFVARRLPAAFIEPWDRSLQAGMLEARARYGAQWLSLYLNAPVWCFALGETLCGAPAWAGVLMPGVDRVGRYFPFTLARPVAPGLFADWLRGAQPWFEMAVELALSTLAPSFDLERFADQVCRLDGFDDDRRAPWRYAGACEGENNGVALGECLAAHTAAGDSLWWSEGSAQVEPALRVAIGLLDGPRFADLLDAARAPWKAAIALQRV